MTVWVLEVTRGGYDGMGMATTHVDPRGYADVESARRAAEMGDRHYNRRHVGWQRSEVRQVMVD